MYKKIIWPDNKKFAFTIFDDTDRSNLKDSKIIYQYLEELGFKTTRSVWMLKSNDNSEEKGVTCEDNFYLDWLLEIKNKGYEIGYHNATSNSSKRQNTKEALDRFVKIFGEMPTVMANHSENKENIYWDPDRLSDSRKIIYNILTFFKKNKYYEGHKKFSSYFWDNCLWSSWWRSIPNFRITTRTWVWIFSSISIRISTIQIIRIIIYPKHTPTKAYFIR